MLSRQPLGARAPQLTVRCLLRCRRPPLIRQNDQARVVSATMDQTGLFGVADRLFEGQTCKAHITTDAFCSPPGMRGLGTKAVELGDERRRALKTVLVAHRLMVPQRHGACQH